MTLGEGDQLARAADIDEAESGEVQVDFPGAVGGQRGERGSQPVPDGEVRFAGQPESGVAAERTDGERA